MIRRCSLAALVCLAMLHAACAKETPEEVESKTVVAVSTSPAELGGITAVIQAIGVVSPAPGAELIVIAPEAAQIAEIPKAEGDAVRRGDVLVRFEIPSAAAEVSKQRAEISRAQARIESARASQARARDLFDRGVGARKDVEEAVRELADADADLAAAQAAATAADAVAARSIVHAPFDGIVVRRAHNPGDFVEATASDAVLRVVDPLRLEVVAQVPVNDSPRIRVGAPARIRVSGAGAGSVALQVTVRPVAVQPGTATVPVRLGFRTPPPYPIGAPVQVEIDAESHSRVVLVPVSAVVHEGNETAVFVAADKKAERRVVTTGIENGRVAEIASGVKAGEMVITAGQNGLPDKADISTAAPGGEADDEDAARGAGAKSEAKPGAKSDAKPK